MTYRITVISNNQQHIHIQVENLNRDNLNDFINNIDTAELQLHLKLVTVNLDIEDCRKLGLFLKTLPLKALCLKDSTLSVEASVELYSHVERKENLINYCFYSAATYYQKALLFQNHDFGLIYKEHAQSFAEAGKKIAVAALNDYNSNTANAAHSDPFNCVMKSP